MTSSQTTIDPVIFRAYDIRGIVGESLTEESVYEIGRAIGSIAQATGETRMAVGRDGRLSSPSLGDALRRGILDTGCDVIDIGIVPTPLLYYATNVLETRSGVMLTGSHNPPEYNGLKTVINGKTLTEDEIKNLQQRTIRQDYATGHGFVCELEIIERYISHVFRTVKLGRPLKVVVDCGNSVSGLVAPELFRRMGCEVHELFCDLDGNFPNHHPDPSQPENLQDLKEKIQAVGADVGFAFDGDGDRLGVVTGKGEIIWPDRQLMLFSKAILAEHPGAKIIFDVKCSSNLAKVITEHGGEPIMWKTGHSLIKSKLAETQALLAGEMSGHIFLKDRWYGFDDAIYAAARMLEIISSQDQSLDSLFDGIPDSINTPELKIHVSEAEKFQLMDKLIAHANFTTADKVMTIDGLRVNFSDGWGLVRPSNTTPCLVLRFEADSETVMTRIKNLFREFILAVDPALDLPF
jgi:phosphomannomutase/phosphoglucomutase